VKRSLGRFCLFATVAALSVFAATVAMRPWPASAATLCTEAELVDLANRPDAAPNSCVVGLDDLVLESGYYQNASSVGGAVIARYPNAELRVGVAEALEVDYDAPSQIDVSGNRGKGFWSLSDPGVGVKWQVADRPSTAFDLDAEVRPPASAASFPWQPKYSLQLDSTQTLDKRVRTNVDLGLVGEDHDLGFLGDDHFVRMPAVTPGVRSTAGIGFATSPASLFSVELNDQTSVARSLRGQSFGDLSYRQTLSRHVVLDVEGGQTFNTSAGTRPHYIGAGLAFGATR